MMEKYEILKKITDTGIIAVVRADSREDALQLIEAIQRGGITTIEITMTIPRAVDILKELSSVYMRDDRIVIGAGTVLDGSTCKACIDAGAQFVVSPGFSSEVIKTANRYAVPVMSGAMTITEVVSGLELGADLIKVFPGSLFGPAIIKNFKGPIPQACYVPTGGVSLGNMAEWFKAGACAVGVGSDITNKKDAGDYSGVERRAKEYAEQYRAIKKGVV